MQAQQDEHAQQEQPHGADVRHNQETYLRRRSTGPPVTLSAHIEPSQTSVMSEDDPRIVLFGPSATETALLPSATESTAALLSYEPFSRTNPEQDQADFHPNHDNETGTNSHTNHPQHLHLVSDGRHKSDAHAKARKLHWFTRGRLVLYDFHECPPYLQDNEWILTSYRAHCTYTEACISLFHFHNESANVWSHFVPGLVCIVAFVMVVLSQLNMPESASIGDYVVMCVFLGCAAYTFLTSALFHLNLCVSKEAFVFFGCLDYSGISASICGGAASIAYYLLYCEDGAKKGWLSALVIINLVGIVGPMFKFWNGPSFRTGRAIVYLTSGALSCAPVIYFISRYGVQKLPDSSTNFAVPGICTMALVNFSGAVIYAMRVPERFWPGKFDCFGHSHMIWHSFVVVSTTSLYFGIRGLMAWRHDPGHSCAPYI